MGFPIPPYQVIDISGDKPGDIEEYVLRKIRQVSIPHVENDRIGVTIRVSMPGALDKFAKHGGLHITKEKEVLRRVLEKHQQHKPDGKVVVQHTVDARCSGTILKEREYAVVEAIFGDAPPLLEGVANNYESWVFLLESKRWKKEITHGHGDEEKAVLTTEDLKLFEDCIKTILSNTYLEWSISKGGKFYFYEYLKLKS